MPARPFEAANRTDDLIPPNKPMSTETPFTKPPHDRAKFGDYSRLVEAVSIMREMLKALPSGHCADFHHAKKDQHGYHEPCPVAERYRKMVARAEAFVASHPSNRRTPRLH